MWSTGRKALASCAGVVLVSAVALFVAPSGAGAVAGVSTRSLDVVGGPTAAGSTAVVVSVDTAHTLHLDGVDPLNDSVLWQHPYSASDVTPGVALTPAAVGNTVVDVVPAENPASPVVAIAGIDAATGALEWQLPGAYVLSDNPGTCVNNQDFCITAYNTDGSSELAIIDATTGQATSVVNGPNRALGTNLYQSADQTPTFEQLSSSGAIAWTKTVASIFGAGYDPGSGWDITPVGSLNVGSVGFAPSGSTFDFSRYKTVGFSVATGATNWSIPGSYQCMGTLGFLSTQTTCQYTGTIHYAKGATSLPSLSGVTLTLVGFNPTTGSRTWSYRVSDVTALTLGNGVRFVDDTRVAVRATNGKLMSLDTSTGTATMLKAGQVLWCEKIPTYRVVAAKGTADGGKRTGQPQFFPCTANGASSNQPPPSTPSTIGTTVNGVFVWPSPSGLRTLVVGEPVSQT